MRRISALQAPGEAERPTRGWGASWPARRGQVRGGARKRGDSMTDALPPRLLREAYDRSADRYDARFAALQAEKYDALLARLSVDPRARVADLGCGTGLLLARLPRLERPPLALDFSGPMLRRASAGAWRVQGDLRRLPLASDRFDLVFSVTSLLLAPGSARGALAEMARVLAPGGCLALTLLARDRGFGVEEALRAVGFLPGPPFSCGQDVGWICRRPP
ncbi:MAG: class I SAM-dependent methyltransferase [Planctomycetota bacterium]|nr:MAG: class I SAM-dependent methyltransferase [Planctomycetota bacterium]